MASELNWIGDVATLSDVPNYLRVQIIVRRGTATISRVGAVVEEKAGVTAVEAVDSRARLIRFDDGSAWLAKLPPKRTPGGCGCS